jgi:hypothetical protein
MSEMTLKERVTAFKCFELPGQPMFAHIGTSYLVTDLSNEVERLENELLAATIRIDNDARTIESLTQERDDAVAESLEQFRLLGMGSEREAALLGKVDRLERDKVYMQAEIDELRERLKSLKRCIGDFEGTARENIELRAELSKVTDELFALSQDDGKVERALDRANAEIEKLRAELDAAIAVWTSVDDALPEKNVECLVYWGDASGSPLIGVAQRCVPYEGILMWRGHGGSHNDVTHWMPPPKRPAPGAPLVKAGWVMAPKESA